MRLTSAGYELAHWPCTKKVAVTARRISASKSIAGLPPLFECSGPRVLHRRSVRCADLKLSPGRSGWPGCRWGIGGWGDIADLDLGREYDRGAKLSVHEPQRG